LPRCALEELNIKEACLCEERQRRGNPLDNGTQAREIASLRLLPRMACMQKMQRSDVSEHFSAAKTHESVPPRFVTVQRGEMLAMTKICQLIRRSVWKFVRRFEPGIVKKSMK
jgi:site-specific recombinase XerD